MSARADFRVYGTSRVYAHRDGVYHEPVVAVATTPAQACAIAAALNQASEDAAAYFADVVGAHGAFSEAAYRLSRRADEARARFPAAAFAQYAATLAAVGLEVGGAS